MTKTALAQIMPERRHVAIALSRRQKAAIIVRFLTSEGANLPLAALPDDMQADLTAQVGAMRYVDRQTLLQVVNEFATELESMGLVFPDGLAGALDALDAHLSPQTAARLRKEAGVRQSGDPWDQVRKSDRKDLLSLLETESLPVASVLLSKLDVASAADLLSGLPGARARRIAFAMSQTENVSPDAVERIGIALAAQLSDRPDTAFAQTAVDRVGEILNYATAATRDDVLNGLQDTDQGFADQVRRAVFTFAHVAGRLRPVDVPRVLREVDQATLICALASADGQADLARTRDFLLENISSRMADSLREEIAERGTVAELEGEMAQSELVRAIRRLETEGELSLIQPEQDSEIG